ncbi:hypothetical protein K440DRAFT_661313 [Wilcoxina mikolae CBS 423.85]|nr:hypothetical protein K440DRAFT_661313 [Wilcoxina mikolae CBS 423.85]
MELDPMSAQRSTSWASSNRTTGGFDVTHYYADPVGPESPKSLLHVQESENDTESVVTVTRNATPPPQTTEGYSTGTAPVAAFYQRGPNSQAIQQLQKEETGRISHCYLRPDFESTVHKRTPQAGRFNIFNPGTRWRWESPHAYTEATVIHPLPEPVRYRDAVDRVRTLKLDRERYPEPSWAKLRKLMVATVDDIYASPSAQTPGTHSWRRTYIRNAGPTMLRVAYWPFKGAEGDFQRTSDERWMMAAKWIPAVIALMVVMPFPTGGRIMANEGKYDIFPYKYHGYAKEHKNIRENRVIEFEDEKSQKRTRPQLEVTSSINPSPAQERILRPTYLLYLEEGRGHHLAGGSKNPYNPNDTSTPYIFVAYSTTHFSHDSEEDKAALTQIGEYAARKAGVGAFWCALSCLLQKKKDMYRMSDIIRGAVSLVIVLKQHPGNLQEWGSRMWTFPEALLSPAHKDIHAYTMLEGEWEENGQVPRTSLEIIPKNDFPRRAWGDAMEARQLIEHFEGTQTLSRLELAVMAFRCLHRRGQKKQYFEGDLSYALMGLLRRRPQIDSTDSEFQAFARLSLANDSDCLLERLVCLLPQRPGGHWLTSDDAWGACPWDIYPKCQVAGICDDDSVLLDGCRAAGIKWDGFTRIIHRRRWSWKRWLAVGLLRWSGIVFIIISLIVSTMDSYGSSLLSLLLFAAMPVLAAPWLIRVAFGGKFWSTEARLFGFEGYMDIKTIESYILGFEVGRMKWGVSESRLSRHSANAYGERVGRDPTDDPAIREMVENAKNSPLGAQKIFTIVDTHTMTVNLISAVRPPVVALVCGSEGGMLRAVLCSYDWGSQTLYRESVLRMETPSLDRMNRIQRVRFGFQRPSPPLPIELPKMGGVEDSVFGNMV